MNKKSASLIIFIVSILLLFLIHPSVEKNNPQDVTGFPVGAVLAQDLPSSGVQQIQNVMQLLQEEYISEVDSNEMLSGAVEGLKGYLKARNVDVTGIENPVSPQRTPEANIRAFGRVYEEIALKYGQKYKEENLIHAALSGAIKVIQDKYDDPYTVAMNPEQYRLLQEQLNSTGFSGIGILIELDKENNNTLMVVEPIEGTPAQEAGLQAGDLIIRINGVSTRGMSLDVASARIRGPENSTVKLTIQRKGSKPFDVDVARKNIVVKSLTWESKNDVGYIKLRFFGETTPEEYIEAISRLKEMKVKGIVLDLRNNGGGYVDAAIQVCSAFANPGTTVTSMVNYRKGIRNKYESYNSISLDLPLIVLINNYSASASEITAGFVKDLKLGKLLGSKTFGKGSVQTIHRISGGGAVKFTTAHYLTPKGIDINKKGIEPDITVEMDPAFIGGNKDIQLKKAMEIIRANTKRS